MEHLFTGDAIIALISLTVMEIILGIDNIIFISIITGKLPVVSQAKARNTAY
jgi:predicted tellurium resistance membrane protein TerC